MARWFLAVAALLLACGCPADPGKHDAGPEDAGLRACLERPTDRPAPPSNGLPCDMLPPGFAQ